EHLLERVCFSCSDAVLLLAEWEDVVVECAAVVGGGDDLAVLKVQETMSLAVRSRSEVDALDATGCQLGETSRDLGEAEATEGVELQHRVTGLIPELQRWDTTVGTIRGQVANDGGLLNSFTPQVEWSTALEEKGSTLVHQSPVHALADSVLLRSVRSGELELDAVGVEISLELNSMSCLRQHMHAIQFKIHKEYNTQWTLKDMDHIVVGEDSFQERAITFVNCYKNGGKSKHPYQKCVEQMVTITPEVIADRLTLILPALETVHVEHSNSTTNTNPADHPKTYAMAAATGVAQPHPEACAQTCGNKDVGKGKKRKATDMAETSSHANGKSGNVRTRTTAQQKSTTDGAPQTTQGKPPSTGQVDTIQPRTLMSKSARRRERKQRQKHAHGVCEADGTNELPSANATSPLRDRIGIHAKTLEQVCRDCTSNRNPLCVIAMNQRSSHSNAKTAILLHALDNIPDTTTVVVTLQETWLKSSDARQKIRNMQIAGWQAYSLERSSILDNASGGIMTLVRPATGPTDMTSEGTSLKVSAEIVDELGITRTNMHRVFRRVDVTNDNPSEYTSVTETAAIFNIYVPTGANKLTTERLQVMESRLLGHLKNACENHRKVVVAGDLNDSTKNWVNAMVAMGFRVQSQVGVEIILVKQQELVSKAGWCDEVCQKDSLLYTDHTLLYAVMDGWQTEEEWNNIITIDRDIVLAHQDEFKAELSKWLVDQDKIVEDNTEAIVQRMRQAEKEIARIGRHITLKYRKKQGGGKMMKPRKIHTLLQKIGGHIDLKRTETKHSVLRKVKIMTAEWQRERQQKLLQNRDESFERDKRKTFRSLTQQVSNDMRVLSVGDKEYRDFKGKNEVLHNNFQPIFGETGREGRSAIDDEEIWDWEQYCAPDPRNLLQSIGSPVSDEEIEAE
ncbi:MAG TPA: hypothetical protein V6C97_06195, partial [Oculatellaceae cyanobacterium]